MDTSCEDEWSPRAKCLGRSDEFELSDWPEPEERLGRERDPEFVAWLETERTKFEKSEEVCLDCPVFVQCDSSASKNDKAYTMRGGKIPTILTRAEKYPAHICGRPSHISNQIRDMPFCQKCVREEGKRRTAAATRERMARLKAKRMEAADPRFM